MSLVFVASRNAECVCLCMLFIYIKNITQLRVHLCGSCKTSEKHLLFLDRAMDADNFNLQGIIKIYFKPACNSDIKTMRFRTIFIQAFFTQD